MQEEFIRAHFREAINDSDYELELAHLPVKCSGLALPNTVNSAALNHQASKDVCSHLQCALKMRQLATHTTMQLDQAQVRARSCRRRWRPP